jgi:hypothetical protein
MIILRTFFLLLVLLIIYYIYDRNIIILDNLTTENIYSWIQYLFSYLDNLLNRNNSIYSGVEAFSNGNRNDGNKGAPTFKITLDSETHSKLPEINCLSGLFKKLYSAAKTYSNETMEYNTGIGVRLEYYFTTIQNQCTAVYNDDKPNLQMSYLLDIQHKILKIIHDFIFITPGSNLPDDLIKLEEEFKECFHKINSKLTLYNNKKFIYTDGDKKEINTNSGFIEHPDEPLAKNTYYDNFGFY